MAQVELKRVNKFFGETEVIRNVDLEINKGESLSFLSVPPDVENQRSCALLRVLKR